jgi:transposase
MNEKRKYNPELKAEAVKLVNEQGLTQAEVSKRLGIPKGTIGNWVSGYTASSPGAPSGEQSYAELKHENVRLRKELSDTRMERELLKKAAAYFAKESLPGTRS